MARAWRTDENFSGDVVFVVTNLFAKCLAELLVDTRHLKNRAVEHRRESSAIECAQDFLRFAQRITEEHRDDALVDDLRHRRLPTGRFALA